MNQENLWAPWRMAYLRDLERRRGDDNHDAAPGAAESGDSNFLRYYWTRPDHDDRHHVIERDTHGMILLNRYPYANGHLLVALGEARPTLLDYEPEQRAAFWRLVERGTELIHLAINPQGLNIGINQGDAAGAGVPEHLHGHLVPRWTADTNFITTIGGVRVIPDSLEAMFDTYRAVCGGPEARRGMGHEA